ncbi:MAG: TerC family protein [Acidobacteria bacterium]|nr:TerC family protein [Acidobacteriota bacterium]
MPEFSALLVLDILTIVLIDLLLAGDNAVVIAMAVKSLPEKERKIGIALGAGVAVVLRIVLTFFASKLLTISYLKLVGGILIFWIAIKLLTDAAEEAAGHHHAHSVWSAVWYILVADITMSTDNVLAVAGTSKGNFALLLFGLGLSIPFVVFTSSLLSTLMDKYPLIIWAGAAILGRVGADMILTDPVVESAVHIAEPVKIALQLGGALLVVALGKYLSSRAERSAES